MRGKSSRGEYSRVGAGESGGIWYGRGQGRVCDERGGERM